MQKIEDSLGGTEINIQSRKCSLGFKGGQDYIVTDAQLKNFAQRAPDARVAYEYTYSGRLEAWVNTRSNCQPINVWCRQTGEHIRTFHVEQPVPKSFEGVSADTVLRYHDSMKSAVCAKEKELMSEHMKTYNLVHNRLKHELQIKEHDAKNSRQQARDARRKAADVRAKNKPRVKTVYHQNPVNDEAVAAKQAEVVRVEGQIREAQARYSSAGEKVSKSQAYANIKTHQATLGQSKQELNALQNPGQRTVAHVVPAEAEGWMSQGINFMASGLHDVAASGYDQDAARHDADAAEIREEISAHNNHNADVPKPSYKVDKTRVFVNKWHVKFKPSENFREFFQDIDTKLLKKWASERRFWQAVSIIVGVLALIPLALLTQQAMIAVVVTMLDPTIAIACIAVLACLAVILDGVLVYNAYDHCAQVEIAKQNNEVKPLAAKAFDGFKKTVISELSRDGSQPPAYTPKEASAPPAPAASAPPMQPFEPPFECRSHSIA